MYVLAVEIISKDDNAYGAYGTYYGFRAEDGKIRNVGDILEKSRVFDDGNPTGEYLDGTSVIGIKSQEEKDIKEALEAIETGYHPDNIYLVKYTDFDGGNDPMEYVAKNPEIVSIIKTR